MNSNIPQKYHSLFIFIRKTNDEVGHKKYARLLYSMYEKSTIEELMEIYDIILERIVVKMFGKEYWEENDWYNYDNWEDGSIDMLKSLNSYLNIQIERVFNNCPPEDYLKCYVNLRDADNYSEVINIIKKKLPNGGDIPTDVNDALPIVYLGPRYMIASNQKYFFKKLYLNSLKTLENNGYIKSIRDITFEEQVNLIDVKKKEIVLISQISQNMGKIIIFIIVLLITLGIAFLFSKIISLLTFPILFFLIGLLLFAL